MKVMRVSAVAVLAAAVVMGLGCRRGGGGVSTSPKELNLTEVKLAMDQAGTQPVKAFALSDQFWVFGRLEGAPKGATVRVVWTGIQVDAPEVPANHVFGESQRMCNDGPFAFDLAGPQKPLTTGKFKVDVFLDGVLKQTLNFDVVR